MSNELEDANECQIEERTVPWPSLAAGCVPTRVQLRGSDDILGTHGIVILLVRHNGSTRKSSTSPSIATLVSLPNGDQGREGDRGDLALCRPSKYLDGRARDDRTGICADCRPPRRHAQVVGVPDVPRGVVGLVVGEHVAHAAHVDVDQARVRVVEGVGVPAHGPAAPGRGLEAVGVPDVPALVVGEVLGEPRRPAHVHVDQALGHLEDGTGGAEGAGPAPRRRREVVGVPDVPVLVVGVVLVERAVRPAT